MRVGKIDVTKIAKEHLFIGQKGKYLDIMMHDNKDGRNDYGDDGFITQSVSKEAKQQGIKGPIIGNWRKLDPRPGTRTEKPAKEKAAAASGDDLEDAPF